MRAAIIPGFPQSIKIPNFRLETSRNTLRARAGISPKRTSERSASRLLRPVVAGTRDACPGCNTVRRGAERRLTSGHSFSFDETKKLPLTVNGPVRFAVNGGKLRVVDEKGKEHKETVLQKAVDKK